jgi:transcriptional/translational regulatory protein YebC/TACO1
LAAVRDALEKLFGTPNAARMDWKPMVQTPVSDLETAKKLMSFIDLLNEDDDVQRVITNADISEDIMAQIDAE